jgi:hypothetical protein
LVPWGTFSSTRVKPSSEGWAQPKTGKPATWPQPHSTCLCSHLAEVGRSLHHLRTLGKGVHTLEMVHLHPGRYNTE